MKYEILKWDNDKATLLKGDAISLFVKTNESPNEIGFENLDFKKAELDNIKGIIVFGNPNILNILGEYINHTRKNLYDSLNELGYAFKKKIKDLLKFRGDLAEAIFIAKNGGNKIYDGASSDINLNGEMIEIKSFSPQKKTIHISLEQLNENTTKYGVEILMDNKGESVLEIANLMIENSEFKKYLFNEYANTIFENLKYKISEPINITNSLPEIKLEKNIIKANFEILIK